MAGMEFDTQDKRLKALVAGKPVADLSIIAANYNNGKYLGGFIESIACSGMLPKELILVDDGSTDSSRDVIHSCRGLSFLKAVFFDRNQGLSTALNAALEMATGKYIMRGDPDDLFLPHRIETQVAFLEHNPGVDVLGCHAIYFSVNPESPINRTNFPLRHQQIVAAYHKGEHGLLHATVCGKRSVYQKYRYQPLSPGEDYELFARMVRDGHRFANLKEVLYKIRIHPGSSTSQISKEAIRRTFDFRDRIFGKRTSRFRVWSYHRYIHHYRQSQLAHKSLRKYTHLFMAILFYPRKLFRRIF